MPDAPLLLRLEALPPGTTKGTIVRLLDQVGGVPKHLVGKIELAGRTATIEVPGAKLPRILRLLDGTALGIHKIRAIAARAASEPRTAGDPEVDHFTKLARWLDLEAKAEADQIKQRFSRLSLADAEASGATIGNLIVRETMLGLGGRYLLTFTRRGGEKLPWTRLDVGSPILASEQGSGSANLRGVVSDRSPGAIQAAFSQLPETESEQPLYRLDLSTDEIARERQRAALARARTATPGEALGRLRRLLVLGGKLEFESERDWPAMESSLNASQQAAVKFALSARNVAIIHGPPGTGKTTTLVELIRQAVTRGEKVLAVAPSNMAVDNLFERLLAAGAKAVRLGHPARVMPHLRENALDMLVQAHPDMKLARLWEKQAFELRLKASKTYRAAPAAGQRRQWYDEAKSLIADARRTEAQIVELILDDASVLCTTMTGIDSELLGGRRFDLAVVDEACQSTEPAAWIPLLRSDKVVLAGDPCQLPPTVLSQDANREGFSVSLLERAMGLFGKEASKLLNLQYRMNRDIMEFSSEYFYEGHLAAHESVAAHRLSDLPHVVESEFTSETLRFIDTAGSGFEEELEPDGESRRNPGEAKIVERYVRGMLHSGVAASEIAVITPYAAQVRLLRQKLADTAVEIDTVDGFQGREKESVVISLVRSNPEGEIGFLLDERRMNVAMTRARRRLVVIGDGATLSQHEFFGKIMQYFENRGGYHTVWEEPQEEIF
jgi:ATP-dependent RNA/DNA helicase IGHMBP2